MIPANFSPLQINFMRVDLGSFVFNVCSSKTSVRVHEHAQIFFFLNTIVSNLAEAKPNHCQTKFQCLKRKYIFDALAKNAKPLI